jgi:predicted O-methyltransferase YrrM
LGRADIVPFRYRRRLFGSPPVLARHVEWSAIASTDDEQPQPSDELLGIALAGAERARHLRLDAIAQRCQTPLEAHWVNHWPGDHYRLLAALVETVGIAQAIEIGTFTGLGALTLAHAGARVLTYDVVAWNQFANTILRPDDFDGGIEQRIGDLGDAGFFESQVAALRSANLIFIDGPKNGVFEPAFVPMLVPLLRPGQLLVFDDIRKLTMLQLWRDLPLPKLDVTSFGHWSGTGLARV